MGKRGKSKASGAFPPYPFPFCPCAFTLSLFHYPRITAIDQFLQTAWASLGDGRIDLADHQIFICLPLDGPENSHGLRKIRLLHAREHESHGWIFQVDVMNEQITFGDGVFTDGHHLRMRAVHANAAVPVLAENHWFAMLEIEHAIISHTSFGK